MQSGAGVDVCNCFAARQASRFISQLYERHLVGVGLTSAQLSILSLLAQAPGMTMSELAGAMVMERTTLVRAIKPLQRDRLVVAAPAAPGGRTLALSLSAAGERKLADATPLWRAAQEDFESRVGRRRAARLRRELLAITQQA
jgi:DNA-binding MarR family transcriptional regulator